MIRDFPVAPSTKLADRAERWMHDPGSPPAPVARPAATVMCLREGPAGAVGADGAAGPEVFMLHRVATMAFAPSVHVFPGGGVDDRDAEPDLPWTGPAPAEWAARMRTDEHAARMLVAAAVREVFEETGVLLAGPADGDAALADVTAPAWVAARDDLVHHRLALADVLTGAGMALRSDLLRYRAHWTTPEFEPRRYETRFFACLLPEGQLPDDGSSEAQAADWVRPADLLAEAQAGRALMLPPTVVCLEQLAAATSAAAFLADEPPVHEVMPVLVRTDAGLALRMDLP